MPTKRSLWKKLFDPGFYVKVATEVFDLMRARQISMTFDGYMKIFQLQGSIIGPERVLGLLQKLNHSPTTLLIIVLC